jgi:hypothetical protein
MNLKCLKTGTATFLTLGIMFTASEMLAPAQTKNKDEPKGELLPQPRQVSYAKFRLDVEIRGTLHITEKGITVAAPWPAFQLNDASKEAPDFSAEHAWKLDFSRSNDLMKSAKKLDGKVVLVSGLSELRQLVPAQSPGGSGYSGPYPQQIPSPYWVVYDSITVTDLKLADGK